MKPIRLFSCCIIQILFFLFINHAEAVGEDPVTYGLDSNGYATVVRCDINYTGAVTIRSSYNGLPVKVINNSAFFHCNISSVTIPDSITKIDYLAFAGCNNLTFVTLSTKMAIGGYGFSVFASCLKLKSITIPTNLGDTMFSGCTGLNSVNISQGVTYISRGAFENCINLTSVTIPSTVVSISVSSFASCTALANLKMPDGIQTLGANAFASCSSLSNLTLPSKLRSIGSFAFKYCDGLTSVVIPSGIFSIGDYAFDECAKLVKITFMGGANFYIGTNIFGYPPQSLVKVYYYVGRSGFTSPKWNGYPSEALAASPEISLQQPLGSDLVSNTTIKNFGTAAVGATGRVRVFTIKNVGAAKLTGLELKKIGNVASFTVTALKNASLEPSASTTFKVTFNPTAEGIRTANLQIYSNDSNENPFSITLKGFGSPP